MHWDTFTRLDPALLALAIGVVMALAWLLGSWAGRRQARRSPSKEELEHATTVAQACLALASLLLAFTFATGYEKYEMRRVQTVDEANAIGTFYRRLELLPEAPRAKAQADVREYVRLHRAGAAQVRQGGDVLQVERQLRQVQDRFAATTTDALRGQTGPDVVVVMPALNTVVDQYEARLAGLEAHVPAAVLLLLVVTSVLSLGLLGWAESLSLNARPRATAAFLLLVVCALYVTFDLDHPFTGTSRMSDLPMRRLAESMGVQTP